MEPAIRVTDLQVRYRNKSKVVQAVDGLSFHVDPGEVVGFLGPNGAGKSSTLKSLMGFVEPSGGECLVFGLRAGSIEAKAQIGYLPEVANYYPYLTPVETLRLYGSLQGLSGASLKKEACELLELVGLKDSMTKLNRNLSKGMLQRVGIAQSLLGSPRLLVLDEVTSGLDPLGRRELRNLLKAKQEQGTTLFFSSHELAEVEMLCDRILLIHRGRLIDERRLQDLRASLQKFALTFIGSVPIFDLTQSYRDVGDGSTIAEFESKNSLLAAVERIQEKSGKVIDIVSQEASIEDYFVDAIGKAA